MEPVNLIEYLPPVLHSVREFVELAKSGDVEAGEVWTSIREMTADQFVDTLTEAGCARWEKILGIEPFDTDTIEDRRFRIKTKFNSELPYTITQLNNMLTNLCGEGEYKITLDGFVMEVRVALTSKRQLSDADALCERVVPANIALTVDLLYNRHEMLSPYTHQQLSAYTHYYLRNEVLNIGN